MLLNTVKWRYNTRVRYEVFYYHSFFGSWYIFLMYRASYVARCLLLASFNTRLCKSDLNMCLFCRNIKSAGCGSQEQNGGVCIGKYRRGNVVLLSKDYEMCGISVTLIVLYDSCPCRSLWLLSWKKEWEPKIVGVCPTEREWCVCLNIVLRWLGLWIDGNCRSLWEYSSA